MRDIEADWNRWSRSEKLTAILLAMLILVVPALLLLGA
jgi:hypothetical protein